MGKHAINRRPRMGLERKMARGACDSILVSGGSCTAAAAAAVVVVIVIVIVVVVKILVIILIHVLCADS